MSDIQDFYQPLFNHMSRNHGLTLLESEMQDIIAVVRPMIESELLTELEDMARQHCHTRKVEKDYNGQVAGTMVTDSGALSANEDALFTLAKHGRFRIVAHGGRMVVGYWPENDPVVAPLGA